MNQSVGAYRSVELNTADKEQALLLLYEGAIRFARQAGECIEKGDRAGKADRLFRVGRILDGLQGALDVERAGELGENLERLYAYLLLRVTEANLTEDRAKIEEVTQILETLHKGWKEAVRRYRAEQAAEKREPGRSAPLASRLSSAVAG